MIPDRETKAIRVLVVDDDSPMCELLEEGLGRDFDVVSTTSPEAALSTLRERPIDVVVTDLRMPQMTGIELCRRVHEVQPGAPVIVLTSFGCLTSAVDAMRSGAHDFLTKPFALHTLAVAISRAARHRALADDARRLESECRPLARPGALLGASEAISRVRALVERVGPSDSTALVSGESGTGKELVARGLHDASARRDGPFVAINCAAMAESLLESELFGHAKGAFTGAANPHVGLFAQAQGGTLFLDEIGDMPLGLQPKLLRVLQERTVRPVGGPCEIPIDVRVVAATNQDLQAAIAERRFRQDLYYRLNVVEIALPPLRARGHDVLVLAQHFLVRAAAARRKVVTGFTGPVAARLQAHSWPGNVRELSNCIERAVTLTHHERLVVDDLPEGLVGPPASRPPHTFAADELVTLEELERKYILRVVDTVGGSRATAAQLLGIDRKTLYRKLGRYGE